MPSTPTVRAQMGCEVLEDRLALSAGTTVPVPWSALPSARPSRVTPVVQGGVLTILGTTGRDVIRVRQNNGRLTVAGKSFSSRGVKRIVIAGQGGGDVVWVNKNVTQPCRIEAGGDDWVRTGGGPTEIHGPGGDDTVLGGKANDVVYADRPRAASLLAAPAAPSTTGAALAADVFRLLNQERARRGLAPLTLDARLAQAADLQALNMARASDASGPDAALQHTLPGVAQPTFESRLNYVGYAYRTAGENIADGYSSAADVMAAWMQSASHRENVLSPDYAAVGVAVRSDGDGRLFFCQVFADPQ